jgi:YHS domain-containing protein
MASLNELEQRISERLARSEEQRLLRRNHVRDHMTELEQRLHRYPVVADRLIEAVIRPRLERLAKCLETLNPCRWETTRHTCQLRFNHTARFPATVSLELSVTRDGEAKTVFLQYRESIVPLFFPVKGEDQLVMPLEGVDEEKSAAWVDARLLQVVDDYLRLEATEPYQAENVVTDPVCGMSLNKLNAGAEVEYDGTRYYFCVEECRDKFVKEPNRYLTGTTIAVTP